MKKEFSRRTFIKKSAVAGIAAATTLSGFDKVVNAKDNTKSIEYATIIDLTKCDGCKDKDTPACVVACNNKNAEKFPEPQQPIKNYWPQKFHEDWSDKRALTSRLTPYNWTFIDRVKIEENGVEEEVFVPRRCMHCDNPACMNLCPFGAIDKSPEGAVSIDDGICMGGAKCRSACPWDIPQRQAGVGLYLDILPDLAGGGVMYKCDFCKDLLAKGESPACVSACPNDAMIIGEKEEMRALANSKANEINGYVYGDKENGGTSTFYISKVPFEKINEAIKKDKKAKEDKKPGRPLMQVSIPNKLDSYEGLLMSAMIAPIAGVASAGVVAYRKFKGEKNNEEE